VVEFFKKFPIQPQQMLHQKPLIIPRHVNVKVHSGCKFFPKAHMIKGKKNNSLLQIIFAKDFGKFDTPKEKRFHCRPCGSRLLKERLKHTRLQSHQERASAYKSNQRTILCLPIQNVEGANGGHIKTVLDEEEEDLYQEFNNTFLDQTFATEEEKDFHMEVDPPLNVHPPLEEFNKISQNKDYLDSEDKHKLDWNDMLPDED
jgi:hypothetical protein